MSGDPIAMDGAKFRKVSIPVKDRAQIQPVVDAVCSELGVTSREAARRRAVAERVTAAFKVTNLPLNMVAAGLTENT
jgi:hypothetical protein